MRLIFISAIWQNIIPLFAKKNIIPLVRFNVCTLIKLYWNVCTLTGWFDCLVSFKLPVTPWWYCKSSPSRKCLTHYLCDDRYVAPIIRLFSSKGLIKINVKQWSITPTISTKGDNYEKRFSTIFMVTESSSTKSSIYPWPYCT